MTQHANQMPSWTENQQIAARLRSARMLIDPNQKTFAERAGMSQHRYNQYETGKRPLTLDAAILLRKTYGLSLDYLFLGDTLAIPGGLFDLLRRQLPSP